MPIDDRIQALERLKGLNEISEEERRQFMLDNEDKLKQYARNPRARKQAAEILYNNNKFRTTFGNDAFNAMNDGSENTYNLRNEFLKEKIISDAFDNEFSPFDANGNRDNNKGLGKDYEKYAELPLDAKEKLLRSDYKSPDQLEKEMKDKRGWARLINPFIDFVAGEGIMQHKRESNQHIIDQIYSDAADKAPKDHDKEIAQAYYIPEITGKDDQDTISKFVKEITPGSYVDARGNVNRGVSEYAANYGTGQEGEVSKAMKDFTIDEMRQLLAKKYVLDNELSPEMASTALNNEALRYIKEHQGTFDRLALFGKDLLISTASYSADKINGIVNLVRMAEDKASGMPTVLMDDQGQIVDPNKTQISQDSNGNYFYTDDNGTPHTVTQEQVARTTLHNMGKNYDGSDDESILNPVFWTRAEQFGTLDKGLQEQYEKINASPYKVAWDPGEESNLWYESFKMGSFVLADAISALIPFGVGAAGKVLSTAGKVGQVTRGLGSAMNYAGRALSTQTRLGQVLQGGAGALGIGYAYQRGSFQETLAQNLANAEEALINRSKHEIYDQYNSDAQFKANTDNLIKMRAAELKNEWLAQNGENAERGIVDSEKFNQALQARAQEEVLGELVQQRLGEHKSSEEYAQMQREAIDSAGDAATTTFLPEAIKYGLVNTMGYRKWLYTNPTQLMQKTFKGLKEVTTAEGKKRLTAPPSLSTMKEKAKHLGKVAASQFWGGSWTNGTDDMMVDAAERINQDSYQEYLDNYSKSEAIADTYGFVDGLYSYWKGLQNSLGQETTLNATAVGGFGSLVSVGPNMVNIASLATREGRQAYKDTFQKRIKRDENGIAQFDEKNNLITEDVSAKENWRDRAAFFIQNGVLSEYYGAKQSDRELQQHADYINSFLDYYQDFEAIEDLVNSTILRDNVEDVYNKKNMTFVNAVNALEALNHLANNEQEPGKLSSVVQEKLDFIQRASKMNAEDASELFKPEELSSMVSEYWAANPTLVHSENAEADSQMALESIAENARKFMEAYDAYGKAETEVQKAEKAYGKPFAPGVRKKMKLQQALDGHWRERVDTMKREIGDTSGLYDEIAEENIIPSVGGRKGAQSLIEVYDRQIAELNEEIKAQDKTIASEQKKYDEAVKNVKNAKSSDERYNAQVQLEFASYALENSKQTKIHYQNLVDRSKALKKKVQNALNALEEGAPDRVLTADEIMGLDAVTRARMLNPNNRNMYSKAQRAEITALEQRLDTEDKSKLEKIQDIARLTQRIKANEEAYSRMSRNPEAAAYYIENERGRAADTAYQLINRKNAKTLVDVIGEMDAQQKLNSIDPQTHSQSIYALMRRYNADILDIIKNENMLPAHPKELDDAISWRKTAEDVSFAIHELAKSKENAKEWEENIRKNMSRVVEGAATREEITAALEQLAKTTDNPQVTEDANELLDYLTKLGYQRQAVTVESEADKKTREEKQRQAIEEKKKELEEKAKQAREQASAKSENNPEEAEMTSVQDVQLPLEEAEGTSEETPVAETASGKETSYIVDDGDAVMGQTLDTDEQIANGELSENDVTSLPAPTIEVPTLDSSAPSRRAGVLSGNAMAEFYPDLLENDGILKHKVGGKPGDSMNRYFAWMEAQGVKQQNITDRELYQIIEKNPNLKVKFMAVKTQFNSTNDQDMKPHLFLVLDYDNGINKGITEIHDKANGGVFESNGKSYLVIGTVGYEKGNKEKQALRDILFSNDPNSPTRYGLVRRDMGKFFQEHPSERFYVPEGLETEMVPGSLIQGFIVNQLEGDKSNETKRSVVDLVNDEERNPLHLTLDELVWGIMEREDKQKENPEPFKVINNKKDQNTKPPVKTKENMGRVFLMVPASNGTLIPGYIEPLFYNKMRNGRLKDRVTSHLINVTSLNPDVRQAAINELCRIFVFDTKQGDSILSRKNRNEISLVHNGEIVNTFTLDNNFNRQDFLDAFAQLNPRVSVRANNLSIVESGFIETDGKKIFTIGIKELAEAGALDTDLALLHTAGSSFDIYPLDKNGKINKEGVVSNISAEIGGRSTYKESHYQQVYYDNQRYLYNKDNKTYTLNDKPVKDKNLITQLEYNRRIVENRLNPAYKKGIWEYYILSSGEHPEVIKRHEKTKEIKVTDEDTARKTIEEIEKRKADQARKEAAEKALNEAIAEMEAQQNESTNEETIDPVTGLPISPETGANKVEVESEVAVEKEALEQQEEQKSAPAPKVDRNSNFVNFTTFVRNKTNKNNMFNIIKAKWPNAPTKLSELENFLKEKGVKTDMIDTSEMGIKAWLKTIEDCR